MQHPCFLRDPDPVSLMVPPPDTTDPAPFPKKKKKKKNKRTLSETVEEETVPEPMEVLTPDKLRETGRGDEERRREDEERRPGDEESKKKKKKQRQSENKDQRGDELKRPKEEAEERKRAGEETTTTKKKKIKKEPEVTEIEERKQRHKETTKRKKKSLILASEECHDEETMKMDQQISEVADSDLLELEQFIPDVQRKSVETIHKLLRYDLPRFREFRQRGLTLRWGRYTAGENLQIRQNVQDFLGLTGIGSAEELFFPQRFPDREQSIKNLKSKHRFFQRIAEGLVRTCEQVYIRAKKIHDQRNHMGRFSEDELHSLQKLHTLHGNDWKTIGNKLGRSIYACEKRHAVMGAVNGQWTPEELYLLQKAVKKYLKRLIKARSSSDPGPGPGATWVQLCSNLPWTQISHKVGSRSWIQCRVKWFSYLKSRLNAGRTLTPETSAQTKIRLIRTLYELQVEEASDVDWVDVAKSVGNTTPMCVQKIFHRMKSSRVPSWSQRSFGEIVDDLFEKELPLLRKRLRTEESPALSDQDHFSLDQIFPKDQEDFSEVDNS